MQRAASYRTQQDRSSGFTLIELLIVIVVIGVLAGVAILAFDPFQQSALDACQDANDRLAEGVRAAEEGAQILDVDEGDGFAPDGTDCPGAD